jgi:hypothetical protein
VVLKSGKWTPTPEQTQKALVSIQSFLNQQDITNNVRKSDIRKILANTKGYRVQFVGKIHGGKKVIWCNFFPAPDSDGADEYPYWKRDEVSASDGGS